METGPHQRDALYAALADGLRRGEGRALLDQAQQLLELEGPTERVTVAVAIVLVRSGKPADAQAALESFLKANAETAAVLTNLAKVHLALGDEGKALSVGRRALSVDPNYKSGLEWWAAFARRKLDDAKYRAQLNEVAQVSGSWRVQLWLAEDAWARGDEKAALQHLDQALALSGKHADALVGMATQLEQQGRFADVVQLVPESASMPVAVRASLARAHLQLGNEELARALSVGVPELEQQLVERRLSLEAPGPLRGVPLFAPLELTGFDASLAPTLESPARIAFLAFSEIGLTTGAAGLAAPTASGPLCRAFPLALADAFRAVGIDSYTVVPVMKGQGLVSSSEQWSFEQALRLLPPRELPQLLVVGRLVHGLGGERQLELDVHDLMSRSTTHSLRAFGKRTDAELLQSAAKQLTRLAQDAGLAMREPPKVLASDDWLTALAAALPVFLVAAGAVDARHLWNATRGLEVCLAACLRSDAVELKLLTAAVMLAGKRAELPGFDAYLPVVVQLCEGDDVRLRAARLTLHPERSPEGA